MKRPEVWGGLECSVTRVKNAWLDQVQRTGHDRRPDDVERFADLGIQALRYPLLWERLAPSDGEPNWSATDDPINRLLARGVRPIAGLVHHGSGPAYANIMSAAFAERLADFAGVVARRYPHIADWTPVNEPLTTARFCGLYGHWHPHGRSDTAFVRILLNECRAIVLAMQAIRAVTPAARSIHTDDGGTVFATERLAYQAAFENSRRDLALDLIAGMVDGAHPLLHYLQQHGASDIELQWFADHPTVPDVIGVDYYITSDRWLDHRTERYPDAAVGGNAIESYADVAAPRHAPEWRVGFEAALARWHRKYQRPVALTEVHLGCTREEQLRWLREAWGGACAAAERGVAVEAVTSWALLGSCDWDVLATCDRGRYESGAFDVRAPAPRPTAVAVALSELATTGSMTHPIAHQAGWWAEPAPATRRCPARSRILIIGSNGTLGRAFVDHCRSRGLPHLALTHVQVDITDALQVRRAIAACRPWAVINATGYVRIDAAEREREACVAINTQGTLNAAEGCARVGARYLTFSSDQVFDGQSSSPYVEHDVPRPLNVYGASKYVAEMQLARGRSDALIVRTSAFFAPNDRTNFVTATLRQLTSGEDVHAPATIVSPTYVPALVDSALDLLIDGADGIWHLSGSTAISWADLARHVAELAGHDPGRVIDCAPEAIGWTAARPPYSALGSARASIMPPLHESLAAYFAAERSREAAIR